MGADGLAGVAYFRTKLEFQGDRDTWVSLAVLVSDLGMMLSNPPPGYSEGWSQGDRGALGYSSSVADLVCALWRLLHRPPGPDGGEGTPIVLGPAVDALAALTEGWVTRWGIRAHAACDALPWSARFRQGAGDVFRVRGLTIDLGPPFVEVRPDELDGLRWSFGVLSSGPSQK
jgi:hypothetical protein